MGSARELLFVLFVLVQWVSQTYAGFVEFNGTSLPEDSGWEYTPLPPHPIRLLEDGWFIQEFQVVGDADVYRRPLTEFLGAPFFFVEWRVQTDALSSLLETSQTPVNLTLGGSGLAFYHTTITNGRVQLLRDTDISLVFVDIEPDVPHTYRIELFGDDLYRWLIDGVTVDQGIPEGPYPYDTSSIVWGARNHEPGITTRWDYIRYGTIPEPTTGLLLLAGASGIIGLRKRRPVQS